MIWYIYWAKSCRSARTHIYNIYMWENCFFSISNSVAALCELLSAATINVSSGTTDVVLCGWLWCEVKCTVAKHLKRVLLWHCVRGWLNVTVKWKVENGAACLGFRGLMYQCVIASCKLYTHCILVVGMTADNWCRLMLKQSGLLTSCLGSEGWKHYAYVCKRKHWCRLRYEMNVIIKDIQRMYSKYTCIRRAFGEYVRVFVYGNFVCA